MKKYSNIPEAFQDSFEAFLQLKTEEERAEFLADLKKQSIPDEEYEALLAEIKNNVLGLKEEVANLKTNSPEA